MFMLDRISVSIAVVSHSSCPTRRAAVLPWRGESGSERMTHLPHPDHSAAPNLDAYAATPSERVLKYLSHCDFTSPNTIRPRSLSLPTQLPTFKLPHSALACLHHPEKRVPASHRKTKAPGLHSSRYLSSASHTTVLCDFIYSNPTCRDRTATDSSCSR